MAKDKTTSGRGMMSLPGTSMKVRADRYRTSYAPGDYAAYRKTLAVKKPPAKKPPAIVTNVVREKLTPRQKANARLSNRPLAAGFGTVTGKITGTTARGGGGYGGGGTRGGGSLSGQGSGTRSAGTSRTGGTKQNDPVRG